jgi:hypothetical protein
MIWQDAVLTAASVSFSVALLPMVWRRQPPPLSSCLITALGLTAIVACYATLGSLDFATASTATTAALWWILAAMAFLL